jgi:hypothetical protein
VPAAVIWALYEDVRTWPLWDDQAGAVTRDGPFAAGTTGTMTFTGQDPLAYRLVRVEPEREFLDETPAGELVVTVSQLLEPIAGGLRITYAGRIDGPDAMGAAMVLGKSAVISGSDLAGLVGSSCSPRCGGWPAAAWSPAPATGSTPAPGGWR